MRYWIRCVFLLLCLSTASRLHACDICGCTAGSQSMGLLPAFSRHFIGLQYMYSGFNSSHPSLFEGKPDEHSVQYVNTVQLWGRYKIGRHIQLMAFLPYSYNVYNDGTAITTQGPGDISLLTNVVLITPDDAKQINHTLLAGTGVKLPTGNYTGITERDKQGLPNTQPGTGAYDFPVNVNYTLRYGLYGVNAEASYIFTTVNKDRYKYGNRLNTSLLTFYNVTYNPWTIIPQAGLRFEYALHDYDNYDMKWLNRQSGGYMCFMSAGIQLYYKNMGAKAIAHIPVSNDYAAGALTPQPKLETGFFFLF